MERGESLIGSILITIEETSLLTGGSYEQAAGEYRNALNHFATGSEYLMVSQYCEFADMDQDEVIEFLNGHRYEPNYKLFAENGLRGYLFEPQIDWENEDLTPFHPDDNYEDYEQENEEGGIDGDSTNYQ